MLGYRIKTLLATALSKTAVSDALIGAQRRLRGPAFLRAINYHATPACDAARLAHQLAFLARHFVGVSLTDLDAFFAAGVWPHDKPGLLITFDDGLLCNLEVAVPLLERYGFTGWFFIPTAFADCPDETQHEFAQRHEIGAGAAMSAGRLAMSWSELRALAARHVVGCHTMHHRRLPAGVPLEEMRGQVVEAKRTMESRLGIEVSTFCWVGGEEVSYSAAAAALIREAGFRYSFMTSSGVTTQRTNRLQLQRTNIETSFPLDLVKFQLCGAMDLFHCARRTRINRLTAG